MRLEALLRNAEEATPAERIEWRDRIAAHGPDAIEAIRPWLRDNALAAFAIRVVERAGTSGHQALARKILRSERPNVPERDQADVDWALGRLRPLPPTRRVSTTASTDANAAPMVASIRRRSPASHR